MAKKFLLGIFIALLCLGVIGVALGKVSFINNQQKVSNPVKKAQSVIANTQAPTMKFLTKPVNILIIGIDQRGTERSRTDTIMVYHLNPEKGTVKMLSIPRDTYVNIPGRGMDKVNHAYAFGGIELCRNTLEQFLGIKIDYYIETNFKSFVKFIDAIGGITLDVEKDIKGTNIKKGVQTLNGKEALAYVRDRKDPMGDIARVQRQQKFIRALSKELSRKNNNYELTTLLPTITENSKTDLPKDGLKDLLTQLKGMNVTNANMKTVPGWFYNYKGISYWKPNLEETKNIANQIFSDGM